MAVLSQVPLFVEAVADAFDGVADVHPVRASDPGARALVRAFRPDAVVVDGEAEALVDADIPGVRVDLTTQRLAVRDGAGWRDVNGEATPESIRNLAVAVMFGGEVA